MKSTFLEHDGCFAIEFESETMAEAALLVRFGMNSTAEIRHKSTAVERQGGFSTAVVIAKHKRADSAVPKRK